MNSLLHKMLLSGALVLPVLLGACATNPVTGKSELSLIPESQEISIGVEQYGPVRQSQGGDYVADPQVQAYVSEIGQRLAAVSDRELPYEFAVINDSVPNAWALPGGKIAVNRGLLTEMDSEAELAAVLGHEIVHAAAKHSVQGMQRGMLLQGAVIAASVATQESAYANLAQLGASLGAQLVNQKYGRDAERESDHYGMQYMSRAGYDPQGAVRLQETFVKLSEGRRQDWLSGLFASHPPSQERVENNRKDAAALPEGGETGKERYRQKIARLIETKPAYEAYDKARKAAKDGKTAEARSLVSKAISIEPREGHFHSLLGDIAQGEKNYRAALDHYNRAISLNDGFFYYYLKRGLVNDQLDRRSAARSDLQRSVEMLPTANAYHALGNIARAENDLREAKAWYAKAADTNSPAGQAALGALVELDLADNPSKYIGIRHGLSRSGNIILEISNPTPRDVTDLVVLVQYPDASGRMRQVSDRLQGRLKAGQKQTLELNLAVDPKQAGRIRSGIRSARIAD
ncbi:MAG: M48 family metalloprotease [Thiogranum sp.]|nr:M48 family metalloprotease [Thiogranum sp.]